MPQSAVNPAVRLALTFERERKWFKNCFDDSHTWKHREKNTMNFMDCQCLFRVQRAVYDFILKPVWVTVHGNLCAV